MKIRIPLTPKRTKVVGARKRKATAIKKTPGGTNVSHYTNFINKTMDDVDKYSIHNLKFYI